MGLEPVAWEGAEDWERLAYELCAEEHGEESCNDLLWEGGAIPEPWGERWLKYEGEAKRMIALVTKYHSADTIAALQSLVGEDKLALGKQLEQSNAERHQLREAVAALQAENAELVPALEKIADLQGSYGPFPETKPEWQGMAITTARAALAKVKPAEPTRYPIPGFLRKHRD